MPDEQLNAEINVGLNEQEAIKETKAIAAELDKLGKKADEVKKKVQQVGTIRSGGVSKADLALTRGEETRRSIEARGSVGERLIGARTASRQLEIRSVAERDIRIQQEKTLTKVTEAEERRRTILFNEESRKRIATHRASLRQVSGGGGGRGGGFIRGLGGFGRSVVSTALGFGLGVGGGAALIRGGQAVIDATQQATAYDRQSVAAERLAGSQEKLNALLNAYSEAAGGSVAQTELLANTTRLLATGYADSVEDVSRFVRATRGASIALGKPQDYVIQETQLAISNTSQKRLDQIGLSIEEVTKRIEELRAANADWSRETAFQEAVLAIMEEKYGGLTDTLEGQRTGVERLSSAWADFFLALGQGAQGPVNRLAAALAGLLKAYTPPNNSGVSGQTEFASRDDSTMIGDRLDNWFNSNLDDFRHAMREERVREAAVLRGENPDFAAARLNAARELERGTYRRVYRGDSDEVVLGTATPAGMSEEERKIRNRHYEAVQQIESNANKQRLAEIENYERQRESIIIAYGKSIVREEEDFARQRARSERDYQKSVADIHEDAAKREAEMQEDLDEAIADARENSNERIQEIEEDYHKDQERAEKKHRETLLKAAGQLDAIAILEERKRFAEENKERKESHKEAVDDARESLQEQIDEAREAHEERLEDAREADEERLLNMAADRRQQLADEDEDREIRNTRAAEDHQEQLNELDRQHQDAMARIKREADEQTQLLEDALLKDLDAANIYVAGLKEKFIERDKMIDKWFDKLIERLEKEIKDQSIEEASKKIYYPGGPGGVPAMASGGMISKTGIAMLHAGEYVVPAAQVASSNGNNYNSDSRMVQIHAGAIQVVTTPGYEHLVGELVEEQMIKLLERV